MKKSLLRECISLKNNQKITENLSNLNIQALQLNKIPKNSLRAIFLKFKTQKASPKRVTNLTIKNDSLKKEKQSNRSIKRVNSNKTRIKVISKRKSLYVNNNSNALNNLSYENYYGIYFRNHPTQNNRYSPKSFENIISIKLNKNDDEVINKNNKNQSRYIL